MSKSQRLDSILDQSKGKEKKYDWVKAADLYEQALRVVGKKNFLKKGEIHERIGHCFPRAAFQAESQEELRERMRLAVEAYEKAHDFYEKLADEQKAARMFRCRAVAKYLGYWLTSDPSERRTLLDECLELESKALAVFSESGNMLEYGRTYNELSLVSYCRVALEWDRQTLKSIVKRGLKWREKAVAALSGLGDSYELATAYFTLADRLGPLELFIAEPEKQEQHHLKVVKYLSKAVDLSEKVDDAYILGLSHLWWGFYTGEEEAVKHYEKTLECGKRTRDNLSIEWGLLSLAETTYWKTDATEDPEKRRELAEKAIQLYDKAQHHYSIISFIPGTSGLMAEHYLRLATWETDAEKRLEFLERSEKAGMEALKLAEDSDIPKVIMTVLHVVSKTLEARAHMESDLQKKEPA